MMVVCAAHGTSLSTERPTKHLGEDVVGVRALGISLRGPEPVKVLTLLWIAEDLVSSLYLFELLGVTAFIRMMQPGKFVISFLDVLM
jgi:hypothetical protein